MSADALRKNLMAAVASLGSALLVAGLMLDDEVMVMAGLVNLITCALWLYGRTLHKP